MNSIKQELLGKNDTKGLLCVK